MGKLRRARSPKEGEKLLRPAKDSGGEVAKFLGLVARVHDYINAREAEKSFPGCRTVVASGLRKRFKDREGKDDFFAANLSASVVFEAQEQGSKVGIKGNFLYVEDDVATAITYSEVCHAILACAKFFSLESPVVIEPYDYLPPNFGVFRGRSWHIYEPAIVPIMNHEYIFRRLSPRALTNLQLFTDFQRIAGEERDGKEELFFSEALDTGTPTLKELNTFQSKQSRHPFLGLCFPLDMDYEEFFGKE